MNAKNSIISVKQSKELSYRDASVSTENNPKQEDVLQPQPTLSTEDMQIPVRNIFNTIKTYIISSEDDVGIQCTSRDLEMRDREPMFVIVDSSCVSDPSSREMLIESTTVRKIKKIVQPIDMPSTSTDMTTINIIEPHLKDSESTDEMLMIEINLQSDNEISVENDIDNDSIVMSYLRNKTLPLSIEELSETWLDVHIPSYPCSPRSLSRGSDVSLPSIAPKEYRLPKIKAAVDFLQEENEYLGAAESGEVEYLQKFVSSEGADIQQINQLGRNALHLAICYGNEKAIRLLAEAGVNPNMKDSVGETPLSLCLWRSPNLRIVKLLIEHGAVILPRSNAMDTGHFLRKFPYREKFVMVCTPTDEEKQILQLLVQSGSLINDPEAPGGRQALHLAAMSNNCELIEVLVQLGANLFLTNSRNVTPKENAQVFRCREAYALLEQLESLNSDNMSQTIELLERDADNATIVGLPVEGLPIPGVSGKDVPGQAVPGQAVPDQGVSDQGVPDQSGSQEDVPTQGVPEEHAPDQAVPDRTVPDQDIPDQDILDQDIPDQDIPDQDVFGIVCQGVICQGIACPCVVCQGVVGQGIPSQDVPDQDVPAQDVPTQDVLVLNIPGNDVPDQDVPDQNIHEKSVRAQGLPVYGVPYQGIRFLGDPTQGVPGQDAPSQDVTCKCIPCHCVVCQDGAIKHVACQCVPVEDVPEEVVPDQEVVEEEIPDQPTPEEHVPDQVIPEQGVCQGVTCQGVACPCVVCQGVPNQDLPEQDVPGVVCQGVICQGIICPCDACRGVTSQGVLSQDVLEQDVQAKMSKN